ncbi:MAG: glycosyltransferase [Oscillospiraceae bacterium]
MDVLSIVVPVYNAEKYLSRCIESILNQRYKNFELILIDDGSTDSSGKICDEYALKDERIVVIHNVNKGVSEARNTGIANASGKYLAFVDSDDFVNDDIYEKMIGYASEKSMPMCGHFLVDENATIKNSRKVYSVDGEVPLNRFFEFCENFSMNVPWNKIFITDIIKKNNLLFRKDLSLGEDLIFCLNYLRYIKNIYVINEPLYNYMQITGSVSLSQRYRDDFYYSQVCILNSLMDTFKFLNVDFEPYRKRFYTLALDLLLQCMSHQYKSDCPKSKKEIIKFNSNIMKSTLYRDSLKYADTGFLRRDMVFVYKRRNYIFAYYYKKAIKLIKSLSNSKGDTNG